MTYVQQTGGGAIDGTITVGTLNEALSLSSAVLAAQSVGAVNTALAFMARLTETTGIFGQSFIQTNETGNGIRSAGTQNNILTFSTAVLSAQSAGSQGNSLTANSSILGKGFVTTATTAGATVWTNPTRVQVDDSSYAQWVFSEGLGAGVASSTSGTITATNPSLGAIPAGFTRTKVETLVHFNDTAVGFNATGDTGSFSVVLQDKTGAALQTVINISRTANGTDADSTVVTDVTTACAGVADADLALMKTVLTSTFARTLAALGTRSWTVNVDSVAVRVTYTKSGIT